MSESQLKEKVERAKREFVNDPNYLLDMIRAAHVHRRRSQRRTGKG